MPCPICDQKPMNCDCTPEERRQYAEIEDLEYEIERLRAENSKQMKQIADAAYLLQGVPTNTPAFEAHRILCGEPPEVK